MKKELDDLLCSNYPKIFKDRHAGCETTAMCWGFDCGDGWFPLIDNLCSQIQWHLEHNAEKDTPQFVAAQVKEKFGGLRFYGDGGDEHIDSFVQFAESISVRICEECGGMQDTVTYSIGWNRTLCPTHAEKHYGEEAAHYRNNTGPYAEDAEDD